MAESKFGLFDLTVGRSRIRRAGGVLARHESRPARELAKAELEEVVWALSAILLAAGLGERLDPGVFAIAGRLAGSAPPDSARLRTVC